MNNDKLVNYDDCLFWLRELKKAYVGDANLDGEFNNNDFVDVFIAGRYETQPTATWAEGNDERSHCMSNCS